VALRPCFALGRRKGIWNESNRPVWACWAKMLQRSDPKYLGMLELAACLDSPARAQVVWPATAHSSVGEKVLHDGERRRRGGGAHRCATLGQLPARRQWRGG
jgi:hypothetical protein